MDAKTPAMHRAEGYDVADAERPAGERWVTMSNALTRAGHGLTLAEKRLIALAVAGLDSRAAYLPDRVVRSKVSADAYADEFGVDIDTAYDQLQSAADHLYNRSVTFYEPAFKRNGKPLPPTIVRTRWVSDAKYNHGEGWIGLTWAPEINKHLLGLKRQFTTYQLQQASALRSIYSWRLLELLMRFETTGWAEYTIEDFAASMDAPEKHRANFAKVRTKIIEPAVKELVEKDGWLIQWRPEKRGRRVVAVRFDFRRDPQNRLPL